MGVLLLPLKPELTPDCHECLLDILDILDIHSGD